VSTRPPRRTVIIVAACAAAVLVPSVGASGHPFGPPLTADVVVDDHTVTIRWSAAEDDWVTLARHVGVFDDDPGTVAPDPDATLADAAGGQRSGMERLRDSSDVPTYLLDQMAVEQDGRDCPGEVTDLDAVLTNGAELQFTCATNVEVVDLEVAALTDVHDAYRTMVTAPSGERVLATSAAPRHTLDLAGEAVDRAGASGLLGTLAGGIIAGSIGWRLRQGGRP
jgi:hypothetical protein